MDNVVIIILLIGFTYGFIRQIQHNSFIKNTVKPTNATNKRKLYGNYICTISYLAFLICLVLNYFPNLLTEQFNSLNLVVLCFIFVLLVFISKFVIIPKEKTN